MLSIWANRSPQLSFYSRQILVHKLVFLINVKMKLLNDHERILPKNYVLISFTYSQRKNTSIILFYVFWPAESKSESVFGRLGNVKHR